MIAQASSSESVHPDVRRAADSIHLPEVQELVKRLAEYGLAVALPHMHGDDGMLAPLPADQVAYEDGLRVSFLRKDDPILESAVAVMWRWDSEAQSVVAASHCRGRQHH